MSVKPTTLNFESLAGRAGKIAVVIEPRPCGGPLVYKVVTHPAALHVRALGIDLRPIGAYTKGNQLHCTFKTRDLGAAIPALTAYFEQIELAAFCKFGYRLPDPAPGRLEPWRDVDPARSYQQATARTWRDRLCQRWENLLTSPCVSRAKVWWFDRLVLGDISRAILALAFLAAIVAYAGAVVGSLLLVIVGTALSGALFISSLLTVPSITRQAAERMIEEDVKAARQAAAEFRRKLALPPDSDPNDGGPRE
jgi:hypothetical protein